MRAHWSYLRYVLRHKWFVLVECLRFGLIWQGIVHDWQKFTPAEWGPYTRTFYLPDGSRRNVRDKTGDYDPAKMGAAFDRAWLHHIHHGSHHWQHWVLRQDDGEVKCLEMPAKYVMEMVADWTGAGLAITGRRDLEEWYGKNRNKIQLHPTTRSHVEWLIYGE